jgi:two-component system cell cycle response regulator
MPVMDGYETLTKLRNEAELKHIPVIMLTAEAGRDNVLRIAVGRARLHHQTLQGSRATRKSWQDRQNSPRIQETGPAKNYRDPLDILVVDDKPVIIEQIQAALRQTPESPRNQRCQDRAGSMHPTTSRCRVLSSPA